MRATVLRTDRGTRLFWTFQDNRGYFFDAEGCYQYCQENGAKGKIQARKLIHLSKKILDHTEPENWYRYRNNFMDLEIDIVLDDWNVVQLRIPDHGWLYIPNEPEQTGTYLCICISALHDTEVRYLQIMEYDMKRKYWHDPGKEHNNNHRVVAWKEQDFCREEIYV